MNVLGISSSPRAGGNTDLLLDEFLRGVVAAGGSAEKLSLSDKNIRPCTQCDYCQDAGCCNINDDMQPIYEKLAECDCLVLASPIYFMAHCAQAKLVIDRCQVFWSRRYILKQQLWPAEKPRRRGVFIAAGATRGTKVFAGAKVTMKWFFDTLDMEFWSELLFNGLEHKGQVRSDPMAMDQSYQLGRALVAGPAAGNGPD